MEMPLHIYVFQLVKQAYIFIYNSLKRENIFKHDSRLILFFFFWFREGRRARGRQVGIGLAGDKMAGRCFLFLKMKKGGDSSFV